MMSRNASACLGLLAALTMSEDGIAQAMTLSNPQGFSAPEGFTLGSTQVFLGANLKSEFTDNEKYEAAQDQKDGNRTTATLSLSAQGVSGDTTYFGSLGKSLYRTTNESGDSDNTDSSPLSGGLNHSFNTTDSLSVAVSHYGSNETFAPEAGAGAYDLRTTTSAVSGSSVVKMGDYTLKADSAWTGALYEYMATSIGTIDVERDQYDYNLSIGKQYATDSIRVGVGGSTSTGETATGINVDSQQVQVGLSVMGASDKLGYALNIDYGRITYSADSIQNQHALLGAIEASYQSTPNTLLRAEFTRTFANSILTDAPGYITNLYSISGQYNFSQHTFLRPQLIYQQTQVLSTEESYARPSFSVKFGQRITDNVSLFAGFTQTKQKPNTEATDSGYVDYKENKFILEIATTF